MPKLKNTLKTVVASGNLHCAKCTRLLMRGGYKTNYPVTHTCIDGCTYYVTWPQEKKKKEAPPEKEIIRGMKIYKNNG